MKALIISYYPMGHKKEALVISKGKDKPLGYFTARTNWPCIAREIKDPAEAKAYTYGYVFRPDVREPRRFTVT